MNLFDGDSAAFENIVRDAGVYFEYGCGASTRWVLQHTNAKIFSVDTDKAWGKSVIRDSKKDELARLKLYYVDVGPTGNWGYPLTYSKRGNFKYYISGFWKLDQSPDCVLIDGRFRVACFLETMRQAPIGCRVIFDDYRNRPHYHVVEEFFTPKYYSGRQAIFHVEKNDCDKISDSDILQFEMVMN